MFMEMVVGSVYLFFDYIMSILSRYCQAKQADREVDKMVAEAMKKAKRERDRKEKRKNKGPRMTSARRDEL